MMPINYNDRYLRTYAARYRHHLIGRDSIVKQGKVFLL
jgi:hypothetical protein